MMRYKALISFSCTGFSMAMGDVRDISDSSVADDLINAGYIFPLDSDEDKKAVKVSKEEKEPEKSKEETKTEKPKTKRKGKKSDGNKDA